MPSIPYHGHPFEVVIPCMTLEEANAEKADLHATVEARAFIRPAADVRIDAVRKTVESLAQGGADEGDYGAGQESLAREILDLLTDAKHAADLTGDDPWRAKVSPEPGDMAEAELEEATDQLRQVGEELYRWEQSTRLTGKAREHAELLHEILDGERS